MVASLKGIDAFLNCLPVVNTVNGLIQGACRSQWQASIDDFKANEASSFKRNFQILVLNKSAGDLFFDSLPLIGNIVALVKWVIALIHGFENDLEKAVAQDNGDVVLLCLANGDLDASLKAEEILKNAALSLDNTIFAVLLEKGTWNAGHLLNALNSKAFQTKNVNSIFDYWDTHKEALNNFDKTPQNNFQNPNYDVWFPKGYYRSEIWEILDLFLEANEPKLFDRMLELLPNDVISSNGMQIILSRYTFTSNRYDRKTGDSWETAALTKEQRDRLIQKSVIAHIDYLLTDLKQYYDSTLSSQRLNEKGYLEARFDILSSWIQHAKLEPTSAVPLIIHALKYSPKKPFQAKPLVVQFLDNLLTQHETAIGADVKWSILNAMPDTYGTKAGWATTWEIGLTA